MLIPVVLEWVTESGPVGSRPRGNGTSQRRRCLAAPRSFLYDGLNPVQEKDGAVVIANLLVGLGVDEYFTRTDVAWQQNFLPDGLGSTLALADASGLVATEYTYEPFGKSTVSGAATTNSFQYTGRENDNTGLYYYRARYYTAVFERFIAEDPIGMRGSPNLYSYVDNNPVAFVDPLGLFCVASIGDLCDTCEFFCWLDMGLTGYKAELFNVGAHAVIAAASLGFPGFSETVTILNLVGLPPSTGINTAPIKAQAVIEYSECLERCRDKSCSSVPPIPGGGLP